MSTMNAEAIQATYLPRRPLRKPRRGLNLSYFHKVKGDDGMNWMRDPENPPACQGIVSRNPELDHAFFPEGNGDTLHVITRQALCGECPVRAACLQFAYDNDYTGVWGGEHITQAEVDQRVARRRRGFNQTNRAALLRLREEARQLATLISS